MDRFLTKVWVMACTLIWAGCAGANPVGPTLEVLEKLETSRHWQGVGRINISANAFCTGTLIAPDRVLTAAHCFFDKDSGAQLSPGDVRFLAGYRGGQPRVERAAKAIVIHPQYEFATEDRDHRLAYDMAVVVLDQPVRTPDVRPFAVAPKRWGLGPLMVVSYAHGRADSASLQPECDVLAQSDQALVTSCDVDFGASGAPIFQVFEGVTQIYTVVSAKAEWNARKVSLAPQMSYGFARLMEAVDEAASPHKPGRVDGVRRLRLDGASGDLGARFLRP